ncbi:neuroblast differentiation-associated protein AHNAK-like isoform X1, partial [Arapaima gigas]
KVTKPEIDISVSKPELEIKSPSLEATGELPDIERGGRAKFQMPSIKMPSIGISKPEIKGPKLSGEESVEIRAPEVDVVSPQTDSKADADTGGSPSKFKLPTIKLPKFGISTAKEKSTDQDTGIIETDTKTAGVTFEGSALKVEKQIKKTLDVSKKISDVNISFPKVNTEDINATRCGDEKYLVEQPSIALKGEGADVSSEKAGMHTNVKEPVKSSRFNLPSLGDVFRGFELEFNVPTLDEVENLNVAAEKTVVSPDPQEKKEDEDSKETEAKTEKGSWFKFPKFGTTSPSKTAKESENVTSLSQENLGKTIDVDAAEDLSPTLSVRSSDAFADISSTVTSEQVGLSEASPTKVMVKYSEPAVIVGVGEVKVPSDVITSTTKTELIHLEPNLPEKFDTDTIPITVGGTSSLERILREDTGDVHVITSNIQTLPDTEHTTIITTLETHSVPHDSLKKTVKMATVPWTVEAPIESFSTTSSEHITVERRVVKEKSGDEKGTVIITQKVTHTDSGEPVPEDAASAIRKLKDTMHSEKLRFFEGDETLRVTVSSHGVETQMFESSTESK